MFDVKEDIILGGLAGASSVAIDAFYYKTGFSTPVLYRGAIVGAGVILGKDRKSTRLNSSHTDISRMPSSA